MTTPQTPGQVALAHEIWALAQLAPSEGIEDAVARIAAAMAPGSPSSAVGEREEQSPCYVRIPSNGVVCSRGRSGCRINHDAALAAISAPAAGQQVARPWKDAQEVYDRMSVLNPDWNASFASREGAVATALAVVAGMLDDVAPVVQAAEQQAGVPGDYPAIPTYRKLSQDEHDVLVHFCGNPGVAVLAHEAHRAQQAGAGLGEPVAPDYERMRHIANEWADMATNGMQWLRNIREGISTAEEAISNMATNYAHCRAVNDAPGRYGTADALRAKVEPSDAEISALWMNTPVRDDLSLVICFARALLALQGAKVVEPVPQPGAQASQPVAGKYDEVLHPFVSLMERELHANAGKGDRPGWMAMSFDQLMLEIYYHAAKLQKALRADASYNVGEHAADVANLSMMVADRYGLLDLQRAIVAARVAATQPSDDTASFKNFHRSLCARFNYVHDEKDWRRDLVSLEEHIAKKIAGLATQPSEGAKLADAQAPAVGSGVEFAGWQERHRVHQGEWSRWAEVPPFDVDYFRGRARDNPEYNQIRQVFAAPIEAQAQKGGADHG